MRKITVTYKFEDDTTKNSYSLSAVYHADMLEKTHIPGYKPVLVEQVQIKAAKFWESIVSMGFLDNVMKAKETK